MTLAERIEIIPGQDGWWSESNRDAFLHIARQLLDLGLTQDQAVDILSSTYFAVSDEFGS